MHGHMDVLTITEGKDERSYVFARPYFFIAWRDNFSIAYNFCECLLSCFQQFIEVLFLFLGECIIMLDSVNNVRLINIGNVRILKITPHSLLLYPP